MSESREPWDRSCIEPVDPAERLEHVRYCSPFAARLIDRHPEWLEQLEASGRLDEARGPDARRAAEWIAAHDLDDGLREFRNQEMLRIVWRDLCGLATLGQTFSDLTGLAETCLSLAVGAHHETLCEKHGTPRDEAGAEQHPVVIALGKLGGGELNLSSDVDIIFCFPEGGRCDGARGLSGEQYFARHARAVISTLGDVRPTGFCFRVDTRLRPFGNAGPVACSFAAMEQYYQREGRDWERYALVKARPAAGDTAQGARLLETLHPFVYRRYLDFGAIESLREMQALIRADTARRERQADIKRGPGGIREIEFLAQGFQLLRGGREPRLQTPRLSEALQHIGELELLPAHQVDRLRDDYITLRHAENRIQAMHDQQSHQIPQGEDLQRLVQGMGLQKVAELQARLDDVRAHVSRVFDETWAEDEPRASDARDDGLALWRGRWTEWRDSAGNGENGNAPDWSGETGNIPHAPMRDFLTSLSRRPGSPRAARRLDRFMPMLLQRLSSREPAPEAVSRLFDLVLRISQRSAYLALLAEHPAALDRTVELFSRSAWVARRVSRFPELLDELIDPALGRHIPDRETLAGAAARKLEQRDEETALAGLNYLKQATCLRLAVAWLENHVDETAVHRTLTTLAEVMVDAAMQIAQAELERRHGRIAQAGAAVIAYGSLGAREIAFDSDLDLVFLYAPGAGESDGKRPLAAERWYARLAQRMVALLTALTPSGRLYEIDTRLRPNGQSGLLVSSMDAFERYQQDSAWTWEAQALTRARALEGPAEDETLAGKFEAVRQASLCRQRDRDELGRDLRAMRKRIREAHGDGGEAEGGLKHGPGGLVDIGFIAQLGVLAESHEHPSLAQTTEVDAQLDALRHHGWLNDGQHELLVARLAQLRRARIGLELEALDPDRARRTCQGRGDAVASLFDALAGTDD